MKKAIVLIPAILLALFMIFMGAQKFGAENIIFTTIAERSGIAFFEPEVRIFTGVMEILAAVLLLIPRARALGALLSVGLIGGAILFHLSPWLGIAVSLAPGAPPTMQLFLMAVGSFVVACIVLFQNRHALPFIGRS